jgi:TPR repeat protein
MATLKFLLPFFLIGCVNPASCAEKEQNDNVSKSPYSKGRVLQKLYLNDATTGSVTAQYELGFLYFSGADGAEQDYATAREWLTKAAEQNHSQAQLLLGSIYQGGIGTNKNVSEALRWIQKAIEKKEGGKAFNLESNQLAIAYFSLGQSCFSGGGEGVKKDFDVDKAFSFFFKAAELGYSKAQAQVGAFYGLGWSVKQDQAEAVKWYEKAAKQGEIEGFYMLGDHNRNGTGVPQNFVEAYKWYSLAAAVGNVNARSQLKSKVSHETAMAIRCLSSRDELAKQMTPEQIAEGQKRTEKFWSDLKKSK